MRMYALLRTGILEFFKLQNEEEDRTFSFAFLFFIIFALFFGIIRNERTVYIYGGSKPYPVFFAWTGGKGLRQ